MDNVFYALDYQNMEAISEITSPEEVKKKANFFKKIQNSWVNNSIILRIKNEKLSGYCFLVD